VLSQDAQDLLNILEMFLPSYVEGEDVIQIYDHKGVFEWTQYVIHHLHECGWEINQAERHDRPLEETLFILEGCLPYISFPNRHLVVA
jgi:hypothetical protein